MSYSPLVSYYNKSPNCESRNGHKIKGFAIHCFVGQVGMPRGVDVFKPASKDASANYVIAYDGEIGCAVDDELRSWCTSSRIDEQVLTIECASDAFSPYAITDDCYDSLIALLVDRCKAYNIKKLSFANDPAYAQALKVDENYQNIVCHRWFENKSCPGPFIFDLLTSGKICKDVNDILNGDQPVPPDPPKPEPEPEYTTTIVINNLSNGDVGADVAALQGALEYHGYDLEDYGGCDGIFGDGTEEAVIKFQKVNGLDPDGVVGAKTYSALGIGKVKI